MFIEYLQKSLKNYFSIERFQIILDIFFYDKKNNFSIFRNV